ncbi:MAG TPA: helix-turn-helix transcriptional regulator [Thermomicrobiales bacterium]|nr:helix-turn-helix transcriptional regulator [Thermomicrobiales bacterium]
MSVTRNARDRLSPAEFTLLGLVTLADGRIHGYDLNRQLTEGAIGEIIRLEPGMIYHYLKKLAKRGFITTTVVSQEGKPDRHLHKITDTGRDRFEAWIVEPVHATREMRLDFLLKLWFARMSSREQMTRLIRDQRKVLDGLVTSLETQRARRPGDSDDDVFARKVIDLRLAQNRAAIDWLDDLDAR